MEEMVWIYKSESYLLCTCLVHQSIFLEHRIFLFKLILELILEIRNYINYMKNI